MTPRLKDSPRKVTFPLARDWLNARLDLPFGDGCEIWPFARGKDGYGYFWTGTHVVRAHRYVCSRVHGEPPTAGMDAAHSCNTRPCFNPNHLRWATRSENNLDRRRHGTAFTVTAKRAIAIEGRMKNGRAQIIGRIMGLPGAPKLSALWKLKHAALEALEEALRRQL